MKGVCDAAETEAKAKGEVHSNICYTIEIQRSEMDIDVEI